jgi:choline-sulfatase
MMSATTPQNLLVIMADEHNAEAMGCAGHPYVRTPNLDALAKRGTRFTNAYTNSPICVPARASFHTGRLVHDNEYWDNSFGYDGRIRSWAHDLADADHRVESIGKLHFQNVGLPTGFVKEHIPMHLANGTGMVQGSIRGQFPDFKPKKAFTPSVAKIVSGAGPGESNYILYDRKIAERAIRWLEDAAAKPEEKPWCLFVSFVTPHYPLRAPAEYVEPYLEMNLPLPSLTDDSYERHPWWAAKFEKDDPVSVETTRMGVACYLGLCTFMDELVGNVTRALERSGQADKTRVLYVSDHGECLGKRGLWGKSVLYREATEIPMIASGEGFAANATCDTTVSLLDVYPTVLDATGVKTDAVAKLPGRSLLPIASEPTDSEREAFSEYHAMASPSGAYMLRKGRYKYHYYAGGFEPELFDIVADPDETKNLSSDPAHSEAMRKLDARLHEMLDPEATDLKAKAAQKALIERHGGPDAVIEKFATGGKAYTDVPAELLA